MPRIGPPPLIQPLRAIIDLAGGESPNIGAASASDPDWFGWFAMK
jgi:hypothetical protein